MRPLTPSSRVYPNEINLDQSVATPKVGIELIEFFRR